MPTKHPRIPVTADPELTAALTRAAPYVGSRPASRVVRDLAIRGAEALVAEGERRREELERLADISSGKTGLLDFDVLGRVDELAWGRSAG